ncbi:MAG TPA: hypothetical protein VN844_15125 [Pyrinomonadaceae bacterium]|nr:hypothetical protein [Pyrinomonadaceae bacterium]
MNSTDQNAGEDVSGIRSESLAEKILRMFQERKTLHEISIELNLPIEIVQRELKKIEKESIRKGIPKRHEYKDG